MIQQIPTKVQLDEDLGNERRSQVPDGVVISRCMLKPIRCLILERGYSTHHEEPKVNETCKSYVNQLKAAFVMLRK